MWDRRRPENPNASRISADYKIGSDFAFREKQGKDFGTYKNF
jgi:hypothetical protein